MKKTPSARIFFSLHAPDYSSISALFLIRVTFVPGVPKVGVDEWNTIFYDQKLTTAILDRLVHHGLLLMHEGQSYRLQHSKMQ